jgi:ANTAR domain
VDDDLEQSLAGMAGLLTGHRALPETLVRIAEFAVAAIPGAGVRVYAHAKDAFGPDAVRIGELFARPAAVSVYNAQILAQSQRLAEQLAAALTSRAVIDQAIGLIMSRTGADPDEAFERLRAMSQSQRVTVSAVAEDLMAEAIRRARARKPGS